MQTSIKWLKDYVDFEQSPEQIADMLTMAGVPVENVVTLGEGIEKVVTGKIMDITKHPNADKLVVCQLNVGGEENIQIVTGAQNVRVGQTVPVCLVGAKLPSGITIKKGKLRGELSLGMLCSASELNLDQSMLTAEQKEGIYILPEGTPLGQDIKETLGLNDSILEFELTANRADCFCVLGLAREVGVLTGNAVTRPILNLSEDDEKVADLAKVTIEEPSLCPRFTARVIKNVKVGASPEWMKQRLQDAGIRSINNVVDITNFVMLEMGQPMHAYDYDLVSGHHLHVRRALEGEVLTTLDDVKRTLTSEMLVIADDVKAVGLAGVMGGLATEVTDATTTVFLEAAAFNSASVRRTGRKLGLRSEASGRFERGVDVAAISAAIDRAAALMADLCGGTVVSGIVDEYPGFALPTQITVEAEAIRNHIGAPIPT
ncbi:MAG: phenylalanine--tRNA ligase subunit beta, partial [Selenomonadales bacterium]|nr:phenylalanine--tRNA ligase subunit beta [Selenomonadales bacterium]